MTTALYNKLANALFGSANIQSGAGGKYPDSVQNYLDSLENQPYMQTLLNQPKQTGLSLDQYKEGIAQGLNFGVPEIAEAQRALKINTPQTQEDIEKAKTGTFNNYPLQAGLTGGQRQGGLLNDFWGGYRDNYNNSFNPNNLMPQNKGFATKAGELLGSVGRFVDSPLGRGLLAYGLNKTLGYDDSALEGLQAYVGRQNAKTADDLYRSQLKQMGYNDEAINSISGNITSDMYKNLASNTYKFRNLDQNTYVKMRNAYDKQLQAGILSPEEYQANIEALNNQYVNSQIQTMQAGNVGVSNQTRNTNMNEQLLPYKQYALQVSPQIAMGNYDLNRAKFNYQQQQDAFDNWLQTEKLKKGGDGRGLTSSAAENLSGTYQGINQMNDLKSIINTLPDRITTPGIAQLSSFNPLDTDAQAFNQYVKTYKQVIGKGLEGGVLRKEDEYKYDQIIPKMGDTKAVLKKKADQLQNMLVNKYNTDLDFYNKSGFNTGSLPKVNSQANNSQLINKLKKAGYSDQKIQQYLQAKGLL